jgi:predicted secreted protein
MTRAVTANFHEMVLEVETETPGTYARICGLTSRGINRSHNMQTSEVPDCDDESLPAAVERAVQSSEVTVSASGIWAAQSHEMVLDWWNTGQPKNIRIGHLKAEVGDTEYEEGAAYLVSLNNVAERGSKVTAEMEIQFDGIPTRTAMAA